MDRPERRVVTQAMGQMSTVVLLDSFTKASALIEHEEDKKEFTKRAAKVTSSSLARANARANAQACAPQEYARAFARKHTRELARQHTRGFARAHRKHKECIRPVWACGMDDAVYT